LAVTWEIKGHEGYSNRVLKERYRKFPQHSSQENIGTTGSPVAANFAKEDTELPFCDGKSR
jgi:hypothetical protein